jgi:hypothetical protein
MLRLLLTQSSSKRKREGYEPDNKVSQCWRASSTVFLQKKKEKENEVSFFLVISMWRDRGKGFSWRIDEFSCFVPPVVGKQATALFVG